MNKLCSTFYRSACFLKKGKYTMICAFTFILPQNIVVVNCRSPNFPFSSNRIIMPRKSTHKTNLKREVIRYTGTVRSVVQNHRQGMTAPRYGNTIFYGNDHDIFFNAAFGFIYRLK